MTDRYQKQTRIGKGGLGEVWKAFDTQLKREVALKRVLTLEEATAEEVERAAVNLMQEATVLSTLNHPNIVTIFDVGKDEEGGFVVMELLNGETLDETIERSLLTVQDFQEVVNQTLEALIAAQAVNMLHRDLKPGNIMVIWRPSGRFQVKILDFGLAKISAAPSAQTLDQGDAILGSIYFMAPEQFERRGLDFRTDLYAMGCIYYFCLSGKYPFDGDTAPQVMAAHLQHKVEPLDEVRPDLPSAVCQWVMWLINRDPEARPESARAALEHFPDLSSTSSLNVTPVPAPGPVRVTPVGAGRVTTGTGGVRPVTGSQGTAGVRRAETGSRTLSPAAQARMQAAAAAERAKRRVIVIGSAISLALLMIVGSIVVMGKVSEAKARDRLEVLDATRKGGSGDVELLAGFLDPDPKKTDPRAMGILTDLEGPGVVEAIVAAMEAAGPGQVRLALLNVVANRRAAEGFDAVVEIFKTTGVKSERSAAATTLERIAQPSDRDVLLPLLKMDLQPGDRSILENTVTMLIWRNPLVMTRADFLLTELNQADGEYRKSLFRILGAIGGDKALARLGRIFSSTVPGQTTLSYDAILALHSWPDWTCRPLLEKIILGEDRALGTASSRAYIRMLSVPSADADVVSAWKFALASVSRSDVRRVFSAIIDRPTNEAVNFLKTAPAEGMKPLFDEALKQVEARIQAATVIQPGEMVRAQSAGLRGEGDGSFVSSESGYVDWRTPRTWIQWDVSFPAPGLYRVEVLGSSPETPGSHYRLICAGMALEATTVETGSREVFRPGKWKGPNQIRITPEQVGPQGLYLQGGSVVEPHLLYVEGVRFTRAGN